MQSLLRAGPSFRVKAKRCRAYIQKYANGLTKFKLASSRFPFSKKRLFLHFLTLFIYTLDSSLNFQFSFLLRPFVVQFPRRFKFLRKRVNFLSSASPLLPFLQRNTVKLANSISLCTSIQKGSHASSYLTYARSGHTLHQGNRLARLSYQIEAASLVGYVKRRQYRNIYHGIGHGSVPIPICVVDISGVDKKYTPFPSSIKLPFSSFFVHLSQDPKNFKVI